MRCWVSSSKQYGFRSVRSIATMSRSRTTDSRADAWVEGDGFRKLAEETFRADSYLRFVQRKRYLRQNEPAVLPHPTPEQVFLEGNRALSYPLASLVLIWWLDLSKLRGAFCIHLQIQHSGLGERPGGPRLTRCKRRRGDVYVEAAGCRPLSYPSYLSEVPKCHCRMY